ncbi:hypothetical protein [Candidatus Mycoplasma haematominutum]|uniref:Uncharacterized protein n=1 Tax=Candidatus Mycoplasma haematominutum 'Birmingham 1' TaxID=1116213 RepID=G8C3S8_9MOLU|nr:hypothetical protein [Candidatus Mycoplasma haematominutum]CCE66976.1 hypothetical protein MHM_04580 [Candidatus Mycoplasma haematominutum 'Birmingham 1']
MLLAGKALSSVLLTKPVLLGTAATLSGGAAAVSIIKLESAHSPISTNVSKLGSTLSQLLEKLQSEVSTSVTASESIGTEAAGTSAGQVLSSNFHSVQESAKSVYEEVGKLIQNKEEWSNLLNSSSQVETEGKSTENSSKTIQFLSKLKQLYEKLKTSESEAEDSESNQLQRWTKAIAEWYKEQTGTNPPQQSS